MSLPQVPDSQIQAIDEKSMFTVPWFTYLQGIYRTCGANIPLLLSGVLTVNSSTANNSGSSTADLLSYSMPGKTMNNNGDYLEIEAWGNLAINTNTKTITLNFGSQTIYSTQTNVAAGNSWSFKAKIIRTAANAQQIIVEALSNNSGFQTDSKYPVFSTAGNQDLGSDLVIKCTATGGASNDINQRALVVKLTPNN